MGPLWGLWRVRQAGAMMSSGNQKISIIAVTLGALALCAVLVSVHQEGASEAVREQAAIAEKVPEAETEADFIQAGAQDKTAPASSEEAADDSKPDDAEKAAESAHVKAQLGVANVTDTSTVTEALQRENIAADLAAKAAKMEDAIVTGGEVPQVVMDLISDGNGKVRSTVFDEARANAIESQTSLDTDEDFHEFVTHRKKWMKHYNDKYQHSLTELKAPSLKADSKA